MAYNERFDKKMNDGSHDKYSTGLAYELKTKAGKINVFPALTKILGAFTAYGVAMVPINLVRHSMSLTIAIECAAWIGGFGYLAYKSHQQVKMREKDEEAAKEKVIEAYKKRQEEKGRSR